MMPPFHFNTQIEDLVGFYSLLTLVLLQKLQSRMPLKIFMKLGILMPPPDASTLKFGTQTSFVILHCLR